jgi:hypothetical protein
LVYLPKNNSSKKAKKKNASDDEIQSAQIYMQAITEFLIQDYKAAIDDCEKSLKINADNKKAMVLKIIAKAADGWKNY